MFATKEFITLDSYAVRCLLPHRDVMALIDGVKEYYPQQRKIIAYKRVPMNEFAMQGYFPACPMFPGTLVIEALAQTSGLMMNVERLEKEGVIVEKTGRTRLPGIVTGNTVKRVSRKPHPPDYCGNSGETIFLQATVAMQRAEFRYFKVEARTESNVVATGTILLSYPTYM